MILVVWYDGPQQRAVGVVDRISTRIALYLKKVIW